MSIKNKIQTRIKCSKCDEQMDVHEIYIDADLNKVQLVMKCCMCSNIIYYSYIYYGETEYLGGEMKITREWLQKHNACSGGLEWFNAYQGESSATSIINALMNADKFPWANWLIVRTMTRKQYLAYAIFAAEQVIDIFETCYPNDDRTRTAIKAARLVLQNNNKKNRTNAASAAASAADSAAAASAAAASAAAASAADAYAAVAAYAAASAAAYAADAAADAAAYAADAAADAAAYAADAASAAAYAADAAASAAASAAAASAADAKKETQQRIITYGLGLLEEARKK